MGEDLIEGGWQQSWDFADDLSSDQFATATGLADWWMEQARKEADAVIPKAIAYGGADLEVMGRAMQTLIPKATRQDLTDENLRRMGEEMAVAFYLLGKVARLFGAYEQGRLPSEDTWYDAGVYTRMGQRIRETGSWVKI